MEVPFIDLKQRFEEEKNEIMSCIENTLKKGNLVLTPELIEFEKEVELYTGTTNCVGVNSGTDALMIGMWALGLKKNDEIIHPCISFFATTGSIAHIGAKPVFCDVKDDGLLDPMEIEKHITSNTKAIMPVHWGGKMADMEAIIEIANDNNLLVIEDSAQSMGSYFKNKHGGTFGEFGAISCHPLKNLNALGDGGLILTDNDGLAEKAKLYRNHGIKSRDNIVMFGVNSRLDVLNSEILKIRLKKLKGVVTKRRINANLYRSLIRTNKIYIPPERVSEGYADGYVMFIVQAQKRDELKKYLDTFGIETMIYYGTPLHLHEACQGLGYRAGDFPVAEKQCSEDLALPHHQHLTKEQIGYVSEKINLFYKNN
jgi:dTDP-4-amino-4,6-dideoxygalactose transaminase